MEAKTVFYEINGQRYSYDTNNRQQTAAARTRIEAAKTAEAAKAQAAGSVRAIPWSRSSGRRHNGGLKQLRRNYS